MHAILSSSDGPTRSIIDGPDSDELFAQIRGALDQGPDYWRPGAVTLKFEMASNPETCSLIGLIYRDQGPSLSVTGGCAVTLLLRLANGQMAVADYDHFAQRGLLTLLSPRASICFELQNESAH